MTIATNKQNDMGSTSGALERGGEGAGDHAAHHNALAAAVNAIQFGREWLVPTGVAATDTALVQAASDSGAKEVALGGEFALNAPIVANTAGQAFIGGQLTAGNHPCLQVTAADVTVRDGLTFNRGTGVSTPNTSPGGSGVVVSAAGFQSLDCDYNQASLACLYLTPDVSTRATIRGGNFTNDKATQNSALILANAGGQQFGHSISGIRAHGDCAMGIELYSPQSCRVVDNEVYGMQELPRTNLTGWVLVSGNVYRVASRTDGALGALFNNGVQLTWNQSTPTTPGSSEWGETGGFIYVNLGGTNPSTRTMESRIVSGYGVMLYESGAAVFDNLIALNEIHDTEGFGIYGTMTSASGSRLNATHGNTLRNVCAAGVQNSGLPWAGIGIAGGDYWILNGDRVYGSGADGVRVGTEASSGQIIGVRSYVSTGAGVRVDRTGWSVENYTTIPYAQVVSPVTVA